MQRVSRSMFQFPTLYSEGKVYFRAYVGTVWGSFFRGRVPYCAAAGDEGFVRNGMHGLFIGDEVLPCGTMSPYCFAPSLTNSRLSKIFKALLV